MSVRLSPRARGDLSRIWDDSAERWGADQADSYIRLLAGGFERLAEDPARGLRADEIRKGYFRLSVDHTSCSTAWAPMAASKSSASFTGGWISNAIFEIASRRDRWASGAVPHRAAG